jgi:hypothetical protein
MSIVKRGANSYIHNRFGERVPLRENVCNIDAEGRKAFLLGDEVRRRNPPLASELFSSNDLARNPKRLTEETFRLDKVSDLNGVPDPTAADDVFTLDDRGNPYNETTGWASQSG